MYPDDNDYGDEWFIDHDILDESTLEEDEHYFFSGIEY